MSKFIYFSFSSEYVLRLHYYYYSVLGFGKRKFKIVQKIIIINSMFKFKWWQINKNFQIQNNNTKKCFLLGFQQVKRYREILSKNSTLGTYQMLWDHSNVVLLKWVQYSAKKEILLSLWKKFKIKLGEDCLPGLSG